MTTQTPKESCYEELVRFLVRGCNQPSLSEEHLKNELARYAQEQGYCRLDTRGFKTGYAWFSLTKTGEDYLREMEGEIKPLVGEVKGYFFVIYPGTEAEQRFESQNCEDTKRWSETRRTDRRLWLPSATSWGTYLQTDERVIEVSLWQWPSFIGKRYYRNQCYECGRYEWNDFARWHGLFFCYTCRKKEDQELDME